MSSEIIPKFYGRIIDGVRYYHKPMMYREYMKQLEGKEFEEIIIERQKEASTDQHAYYRATVRWLCVEMETFAGWDEKVLHQFIARKLLGRVIVQEFTHKDGSITSEEITIVPSTAQLSRKEMSKFIDSFLNWLGLEGIYPPEPDQFVTKKYATKKSHEKQELDTRG